MTSFIQLPKASLLEWSGKKGANDYSGWQVIYDAIGDMKTTLESEIEDAETKFAACNQEVASHMASEKSLTEENNILTAKQASLEEQITTAKETIATSEETIASKTKEIQDL